MYINHSLSMQYVLIVDGSGNTDKQDPASKKLNAYKVIRLIKQAYLK